MSTINQQQIAKPSPMTSTRGQRWLRYIISVPLVIALTLVIVGIGAYIYSAAILNPAASRPITASSNQFDGSYLLTISDADMVGTAYADGVLMQVPGLRDTLSIIPLPLNRNEPQITEIFASNSVTSWPQVLTTSPDGERAYIIETAAEIPDNVEIQPDIQANPPNGRSLTMVELATGDTDVYDVMDYAGHLAVHPTERYVAVGSAAAIEQLGILPVATLDDPDTYQFFAIETQEGRLANEVTSVNWHPSGDYLAVGIDRSQLAFYEVIEGEAGLLELHLHGDHLLLGNTITYGQFTADGNYYLTAEINWAALAGRLGYVFNPRGEMISVRFDATAADHQIASRVTVGQSPEGFAVSPDEALIVTVDMRRTYLPDNLSFVPGSNLNSLSLLTFDNTTGELALIDQYGFEGVLPEHAVFDADGDALAVVIYNKREAPLDPGYIEFWNVVHDGDMPALERTGIRLDVVRGPHTTVLVP